MASPRYVPRAVLVDLEPGTMDSVRYRFGFVIVLTKTSPGPDPSVRSSVLTTSSLVSQEPVTTGPRVTTPRVRPPGLLELLCLPIGLVEL